MMSSFKKEKRLSESLLTQGRNLFYRPIIIQCNKEEAMTDVVNAVVPKSPLPANRIYTTDEEDSSSSIETVFLERRVEQQQAELNNSIKLLEEKKRKKSSMQRNDTVRKSNGRNSDQTPKPVSTSSPLSPAPNDNKRRNLRRDIPHTSEQQITEQYTVTPKQRGRPRKKKIETVKRPRGRPRKYPIVPPVVYNSSCDEIEPADDGGPAVGEDNGDAVETVESSTSDGKDATDYVNKSLPTDLGVDLDVLFPEKSFTKSKSTLSNNVKSSVPVTPVGTPNTPSKGKLLVLRLNRLVENEHSSIGEPQPKIVDEVNAEKVIDSDIPSTSTNCKENDELAEIAENISAVTENVYEDGGNMIQGEENLTSGVLVSTCRNEGTLGKEMEVTEPVEKNPNDKNNQLQDIFQDDFSEDLFLDAEAEFSRSIEEAQESNVSDVTHCNEKMSPGVNSGADSPSPEDVTNASDKNIETTKRPAIEKGNATEQCKRSNDTLIDRFLRLSGLEGKICPVSAANKMFATSYLGNAPVFADDLPVSPPSPIEETPAETSVPTVTSNDIPKSDSITNADVVDDSQDIESVVSTTEKVNVLPKTPTAKKLKQTLLTSFGTLRVSPGKHNSQGSDILPTPDVRLSDGMSAPFMEKRENINKETVVLEGERMPQKRKKSASKKVSKVSRVKPHKLKTLGKRNKIALEGSPKKIVRATSEAASSSNLDLTEEQINATLSDSDASMDQDENTEANAVALEGKMTPQKSKKSDSNTPSKVSPVTPSKIKTPEKSKNLAEATSDASDAVNIDSYDEQVNTILSESDAATSIEQEINAEENAVALEGKRTPQKSKKSDLKKPSEVSPVTPSKIMTPEKSKNFAEATSDASDAAKIDSDDQQINTILSKSDAATSIEQEENAEENAVALESEGSVEKSEESRSEKAPEASYRSVILETPEKPENVLQNSATAEELNTSNTDCPENEQASQEHEISTLDVVAAVVSMHEESTSKQSNDGESFVLSQPTTKPTNHEVTGNANNVSPNKLEATITESNSEVNVAVNQLDSQSEVVRMHEESAKSQSDGEESSDNDINIRKLIEHKKPPITVVLDLSRSSYYSSDNEDEIPPYQPDRSSSSSEYNALKAQVLDESSNASSVDSSGEEKIELVYSKSVAPDNNRTAKRMTEIISVSDQSNDSDGSDDEQDSCKKNSIVVEPKNSKVFRKVASHEDSSDKDKIELVSSKSVAPDSKRETGKCMAEILSISDLSNDSDDSDSEQNNSNLVESKTSKVIRNVASTKNRRYSVSDSSDSEANGDRNAAGKTTPINNRPCNGVSGNSYVNSNRSVNSENLTDKGDGNENRACVYASDNDSSDASNSKSSKTSTESGVNSELQHRSNACANTIVSVKTAVRSGSAKKRTENSTVGSCDNNSSDSDDDKPRKPAVAETTSDLNSGDNDSYSSKADSRKTNFKSKTCDDAHMNETKDVTVDSSSDDSSTRLVIEPRETATAIGLEDDGNASSSSAAALRKTDVKGKKSEQTKALSELSVKRTDNEAIESNSDSEVDGLRNAAASKTGIGLDNHSSDGNSEKEVSSTKLKTMSCEIPFNDSSNESSSNESNVDVNSKGNDNVVVSDENKDSSDSDDDVKKDIVRTTPADFRDKNSDNSSEEEEVSNEKPMSMNAAASEEEASDRSSDNSGNKNQSTVKNSGRNLISAQLRKESSESESDSESSSSKRKTAEPTLRIGVKKLRKRRKKVTVTNNDPSSSSDESVNTVKDTVIFTEPELPVHQESDNSSSDGGLDASVGSFTTNPSMFAGESSNDSVEFKTKFEGDLKEEKPTGLSTMNEIDRISMDSSDEELVKEETEVPDLDIPCTDSSALCFSQSQPVESLTQQAILKRERRDSDKSDRKVYDVIDSDSGINSCASKESSQKVSLTSHWVDDDELTGPIDKDSHVVSFLNSLTKKKLDEKSGRKDKFEVVDFTEQLVPGKKKKKKKKRCNKTDEIETVQKGGVKSIETAANVNDVPEELGESVVSEDKKRKRSKSAEDLEVMHEGEGVEENSPHLTLKKRKKRNEKTLENALPEACETGEQIVEDTDPIGEKHRKKKKKKHRKNKESVEIACASYVEVAKDVEPVCSKEKEMNAVKSSFTEAWENDEEIPVTPKNKKRKRQLLDISLPEVCENGVEITQEDSEHKKKQKKNIKESPESVILKHAKKKGAFLESNNDEPHVMKISNNGKKWRESEATSSDKKQRNPKRTAADSLDVNDMDLPKLPEHFLKDLTQVKVSSKIFQSPDEGPQRKAKKKQAVKREAAQTDDFIPIESNTATKFGAVVVERVGARASKLTKADFKKDKLFGDSSKRAPYSSTKVRELKLKSAKIAHQ